MKNGKEAKSTVVGLVNGSGGIGAACAQMLMGMLETVSWNWAFFFLVCELYSALAGIAGLTLLNFALEDWRTKPFDDQYGAPLLA
jgi:sugar phosphate permease